MGISTLAAFLCLSTLGAFAQDAALERRQEALDVLLKTLNRTSPPATGRITAVDKTWEDWQRRTGELPPDFNAMPSIPGLPDPLTMMENGRKVTVKTREQWQRQKAWVREQFERWIIGKLPPSPDNLRAEVTGTHRDGDVTVRDVVLHFGPEARAACASSS